jgi:hypothetical protein
MNKRYLNRRYIHYLAGDRLEHEMEDTTIRRDGANKMLSTKDALGLTLLAPKIRGLSSNFAPERP